MMKRTPAVLATAVLALAACGGTEIDAGKTEALIQDNVTGPPPQRVECPDGVEAKRDYSFECQVFYDHGVPPARVTVHITDDDGHVRFGPGDFQARP
jgi:Domain of unknown function (DUF4333)